MNHQNKTPDTAATVGGGDTSGKSLRPEDNTTPLPVQYVSKGFALVRIPRGSKAPNTAGWNREDSAIRTVQDAETLLDCNIGLAHHWSGTCSIDLDDLSLARSYFATRGIDLDILLTAPDAVQILSGRENRAKLLYRLLERVDGLPTKMVPEHGFELRCATTDGKSTVQCVLPPSIHPATGKPYEWGGAGSWRRLPTLPKPVLDLWQSLNGARAATPENILPSPQVSSIFEGSRNSALTSRAGTLRRRGMEQASIAAALLKENEIKCQPPLPEQEVRAIAKSVSRYPPGGLVTGDWPQPQPLDRRAAVSAAFPLDALPGLIGDAVREYQAYGQQPLALVASSALAVVSLATQGLADVARDEQLVGPLSLNFLVVAQSGERKTAADKAFAEPLRHWERQRNDAMQAAIKRNRAEISAWSARMEGIKAAIKRAEDKKPGDVSTLQQRLIDCELQKPEELIPPRLRYEDVNPQSLAHFLATGHPSAALWSDEGGMVTGSHGMGKDGFLGFLSVLNRMWDGGEIHQDRKQAVSVHVEGRRLTVSLMVQSVVLRELAQRGEGIARGSGFFARFLLTEPLSTMGLREYKNPPGGMPCMEAYQARVRELLDTPLPLDQRGRLSLPTLRLCAAAFSAWRDYHDEVERKLRPFGDYSTGRDAAAKSAENAARIAGCLHVFDGKQGSISSDIMLRAIDLARWYLHESIHLLESLTEPQAWTDARLLDAWLCTEGTKPLRDVLRLGPSSLRQRERRDAAVEVLTELGRARIEADGRRDMLVQNPALKTTATATTATSATENKAGLPRPSQKSQE